VANIIKVLEEEEWMEKDISSSKLPKGYKSDDEG
jgi:hypothetical protein